MKNKFNFLQIANWLYFCRENLQKIKNNIKIVNDQETKEQLLQEINKLNILIDVLNKKKTIHGISPKFLKNLQQIKKDYGIIDETE